MKNQSNPKVFRYRNRRNQSFSGKSSIITTIITGIAGVVMKDVLSENSKIRGFIKNTFKPKQIEIEPDKKVINAEYSVLNDADKTEKIKQIGENE